MNILIIVVLSSLAVGVQDSTERLSVRVRIEPSRPFGGQGTRLRVSVVAGSERPNLEATKLEGADIHPLETGLRQISTNAIGNVVNEQVDYWSDYLLIPDRPGKLTIGSFKARINQKAGSSARRTIEVDAVPITGRSKAFLGGVGDLSVHAEVEPRAVRVGQELELRLRLDGPGALGSRRIPALDGPGGSSIAAKIEMLGSELVAEPPSRLFRYKLRPTRPGELVIPPIAVSTFNLASRTFQTKTTSGIRIRVANVPRLDPESLDLPSSEQEDENAIAHQVRAHPGLILAALLVAAAGVLLVVAALWIRLRRQSSHVFIIRLSRSLDREIEPARVAILVHDGLVELLHRWTRRPKGALTPDEARQAFGEITNDPKVADSVGSLVEACDQMRFAADPREKVGGVLVASAREVFERIAAATPLGMRRGWQSKN